MDWLSIREFLIDSVKYIITFIVIMVVIFYVVSITQVVGNSMSPTLKDGEVLILNKFKYRFVDVKRGDIISLKYDDTKYLIKRVIGLPGEEINIVDSKLYVNGNVFEEKYISSDLKYLDFYLNDLGYDSIPNDMYLVLGDNRLNSMDSREIGLIKKEDINGNISFRFWPLNKISFIN